MARTRKLLSTLKATRSMCFDVKPQYPVAHVVSNCTCAQYDFEETKSPSISELVARSRIPLIEISNGSVKTSSFADEADWIPPFVAISHIRSQGLGSTPFNSLYMCQLQRLQESVNNLFTPGHHLIPFWIDTACIPRAHPGKAYALELLSTVYRQASIVLALDRSIEQTPTTTAAKALDAIKTSAWVRRLWTIREGALGRCVKFQFLDAALSFDDILHGYATAPHSPVPRWTATVQEPRRPFVDERRSRTETDLLDALCLFERDQRVYLGRAPATSRDPARERHKWRLRTLLREAYLSTARYGFLATPEEATERAELGRAIETVYAGHTYQDLVAEQATTLDGTIGRIDTIMRLWAIATLPNGVGRSDCHIE
ncbi:hypothetical protein AYL99_04371 [Fonsecaea erecta]|uniref:Heterokaryon incompatibility domain-containing protein n=1 Tax=Fonsecaea erecta TaxID=1367422 RepID=A0A178ZQQ4_9EURO|nr:hypothetical protein AYL99_04371 [Fonsecaea erecta]OAP62168.1 hypothetical protein AYL99_04371 [Fonsecaea erecta]